jgi:hypothetical protein
MSVRADRSASMMETTSLLVAINAAVYRNTCPRVTPAPMVHDRLGRQGTKCRVEGSYGGVHGGRQQAILAAVGRGWHGRQRHAVRLGGHRALDALLATIHPAWSGDLTPAGRLGNAAIDGQMLHLQTDHAIVGGHCQAVQPLGHATPVAAQRVRVVMVGEQGSELVP